MEIEKGINEWRERKKVDEKKIDDGAVFFWFF